MSAVISHCGLYRYILKRDFFRPGPVAAVFMVNPSTADASANDATIRKLLGFGARLGWHGLIVANVCAYRATDVRELGGVPDPVGPDNERYIRETMRDADLHIAAWGPVAKLPRELREEWRMIDVLAKDEGYDLQCWGTAKDGHPRHPLMLAYDTPLVPWVAP
jgi:hypothetical protein